MLEFRLGMVEKWNIPLKEYICSTRVTAMNEWGEIFKAHIPFGCFEFRGFPAKNIDIFFYFIQLL